MGIIEFSGILMHRMIVMMLFLTSLNLVLTNYVALVNFPLGS